MTVIELWWLSLAIAAVVIVVVAVLLGLIIAAAQRIDRNAHAIWIEGKQIAGNTVSIWMLEKIIEELRKMEADMDTIRNRATSIDEQLRAAGGSGSRRS